MLRTGGGCGDAGESSVTETRKVKKPRASRRITPRVIKLCAAYLRRSTPRARKGVTDTREKAAGDGKAGNWCRETGGTVGRAGGEIRVGYHVSPTLGNQRRKLEKMGKIEAKARSDTILDMRIKKGHPKEVIRQSRW